MSNRFTLHGSPHSLPTYRVALMMRHADCLAGSGESRGDRGCAMMGPGDK